MLEALFGIAFEVRVPWLTVLAVAVPLLVAITVAVIETKSLQSLDRRLLAYERHVNHVLSYAVSGLPRSTNRVQQLMMHHAVCMLERSAALLGQQANVLSDAQLLTLNAAQAFGGMVRWQVGAFGLQIVVQLAAWRLGLLEPFSIVGFPVACACASLMVSLWRGMRAARAFFVAAENIADHIRMMEQRLKEWKTEDELQACPADQTAH